MTGLLTLFIFVSVFMVFCLIDFFGIFKNYKNQQTLYNLKLNYVSKVVSQAD